MQPHATGYKKYLSLPSMIKKQLHILLVIVAILLQNFAISQNLNDSISAMAKTDTVNIIVNDSLISMGDSVHVNITDSLSIILDSTLTDSINRNNTSKFDFSSVGGNDSTYYSFYGHLFEVDDTNTVEYWIYNKYVHELDVHIYDSALNNFHIAHPAFRKTINNSYLGNTGLAVKSNIFAEPSPTTGFEFVNSYTSYMFLSNQTTYYNVAKPFTIFKITLGPKEEQNLEILHTQNINKHLNLFIRYKNYTGEGHYNRQKARSNAGVFGAVYTKGRFATHANWTFNRVDVEENGGIVDPYLVTDSSLTTTAMNIRLTEGSTYAKVSEAFIDQKIGFFKTNVSDTAPLGAYWFSFQYTYNREKSLKIYQDVSDEYVKTSTRDTMHLYSNNYSNGATFDSSYFHHNNNNFRINLEENTNSYPFVGAFIGYGFQGTDYYYFNKDTIFNNSHSNNINSSYFEGGIYRLKGEKFKFQANYKLFLSGYRKNDMQLDGFISNKFGKSSRQFEIKGYGGIYAKTPDYFLTQYYSNHYRWKNNFSPEKRTSINISINYPYYKTEIGSRFNLLTNYIYFNTEAVPEQYKETFSVFDIYLNNTFDFWKFTLITRLNYQKTSNDRVIQLPEFSGYGSFFIAPNLHFKTTGGSLRLQFGVDARYWTAYHGQAYSPALGRFHNQSDQLVGNYPFIGIFSNFEIKRLRFYLRFEHVNYNTTSPENYFITPNYPTNRGIFRYGIAWTFYD